MRTARAAPLCLSGRGTHVLLQLHRRLLQSHPAAFRPGVSLTHLLRTGDANRPTVRHPLNRPRKRGNFRLAVGQAVTLLADRFYGTPEMICWCCDHGWDYRLRLKSNLVAHLGATRTTTGALALSG